MDRAAATLLLGALVIVWALWYVDCFGRPVSYYLPIVDACVPLRSSARPNLFVTYISRERVPQKVWDGLARYGPEYEVRFFDDDACERYLREHFDPAVLARYHGLKRGAHRADLWRYCVLWREGGVYLDIKTELIRPLADILPRGRNATVLSVVNGTIYQGILHVPRPGSRVMRQCIAQVLSMKQRLVDTGTLSIVTRAWGYHGFTHFMYRAIAASVGARQLAPGVNGEGDDAWLLFEESCTSDGCSTPDRYGRCCRVLTAGGSPIFNTRYADFPW